LKNYFIIKLGARMTLEKNDLKQIEKIVEKSEERTKKELRQEIKNSENKIIAVLSREITDLAEINHAVLNQVSKISELEKRIIKLETIVLKTR